MNNPDYRSQKSNIVDSMLSLSEIGTRQHCANCQMALPDGARFCLNCGRPVGERTAVDKAHLIHLAAAAPTPLVNKVRAAANLMGEQRLVTALFVDIVGSTLSSEKVGPAGWSALMDSVCDWFCAVIYQYEGTIARFVGDELLAFFGAPVAHEDDPVRAVRAALDILETVANHAAEIRQKFAIDFQVRICLSTGPVTIGPVSKNLQFDYSALQGTLNRLAQLEAIKRPMTVLLSEDTFRLVAPFFDSVDLGESAAAGPNEAIRIYQVNGAKANTHRGRGLAGLESPVVGRDSELETLQHITEAVTAGLGRAVLVVGESGLGKTRLIAEWKTAVTQALHPPTLQWAEGYCLSYGQGMAYHLLRELLRSLIGAPAGAGEPETRAALHAMIARHFGSPALEVEPYLGHLLAIKLEQEALERVQPLDPPALQAQYLAAFKQLLMALAAHNPLVLVLEDLQWADPSSITILRQLLPLAATTPLLFCLVSRSHPHKPGWQLVLTAREVLGERFTELTLRALSENDSRRLVANLMQTDTLPDNIPHTILKKAEGNPFFVEEVLRMMIDQGAIRRQNGHWVTSTAVEKVGIPDNLQGLLLARLDRLSEEARHILRVASVIGRRFPVMILEQVAGDDAGGITLINQLGRLESAGLIHVSQIKPELEYRFRNTLLQDAAYNSLLAADRQRLHLAVGSAMERAYAAKLEQMAPQLAQHFFLAGDNECALKYLSLAGDLALDAYANQEAESRYRQALELTPALPEQAALMFKLGQALYWQSRFPEAIQTWGEGIRLYQQLGNSDGVARLYARSIRAIWDAGDTPGGLNLCQEGLAAVAGAPASPGIALLLHEAARAYLFNGLPEKARPLCQQALEMAEHLEDVTVQTETLATIGLLPDQSPEEALAALHKAAELAEAAGLLSQAARAHVNLAALLATIAPDFHASQTHYRRAAELQRLRGNKAGELLGLGGLAGVLLETGDFDQVDATLPIIRQLLLDLTYPGPAAFHNRLSEALLHRYRGELVEATETLRALQAGERQRGNLQNLVDVDGHLGEITLAFCASLEQVGVPDWVEAETALLEAIEISDRWAKGGTRPRCLLSMVYTCQGKYSAARQLLQEAASPTGAPARPLDAAWLALADARLAAAEGKWTQAFASFTAVTDIFTRLGMRWWQARVLVEWAEVILARGEPTGLEQARSFLQQAAQLFGEIGAAHYTKLAKERLQNLEVQSYAQALAHQKVAQEMIEAGKIQTGFLPVMAPRLPGWQFAAALEPSHQTSGDFYDFIPLPNGRLGIVIADVADKGAAAALFMALTISLIRTYAVQYDTEPERVLSETNRRILEDTHTDLFVTVFYAILDPTTGTLLFSNAGHNPPYHFPNETGDSRVFTKPGIPVGVFEDTTWTRDSVDIAPDDVVVLYTDGVTDAQNERDEFFSTHRLLTAVKAALGSSAEALKEAILTDIHRFVGGVPQFDDITLVVLVRQPD